MRYDDVHFRGRSVGLDGNQFERCRFTNVLFEYAGGPVHLVDCAFESIGWDFRGELARGLAMLGHLYAADQAAALGHLIKAMFPKSPERAGQKSEPHPSLAAVLSADDLEAGVPLVAEKTPPLRMFDYSRLKGTIKRGQALARAA